MRDYDFLMWLADRLVNVYKENDSVDFVHKLKDVALRLKLQQENQAELKKALKNILDA